MQPVTPLCLPATARSHSLPGTRGLEFSADGAWWLLASLPCMGQQRAFLRGGAGWAGGEALSGQQWVGVWAWAPEWGQ